MVLEENGMTHLSASILQGDKPPFDLKNAAIYQFPEVATTGYYDPDLGSFVGISSDKTYDDLKESLGKYGFASGIEYMIKEGIILVSASSGQTSEEAVIPDWIRNNAGWWSADQIGDKDFLAGIEYLVKSGIINVGH